MTQINQTAQMTQQERRIFLIKALLDEEPRMKGTEIPADEYGQRRLLRALMNIRPPRPASEAFLRIEGEYLKELLSEKGIVDGESLMPTCADGRLFIWQGDITRLKVDAIVNAANSALLGCMIPLHDCIDNAIHTMSGVELRIKCNKIMQAQGREEETGTAKITPGYNLPAAYVLHTVGPIIADEVTAEDERLLSSCYESCLSLAAENGCRSIAFCCISTGVFRFPNERAARIAAASVRRFLDSGNGRGIRQVVFNVFKDKDLEIYKGLLDS